VVTETGCIFGGNAMRALQSDAPAGTIVFHAVFGRPIPLLFGLSGLLTVCPGCAPVSPENSVSLEPMVLDFHPELPDDGAATDSADNTTDDTQADPSTPLSPAGVDTADAQAPVADAGSDQTVLSGATVQLDATASRDPTYSQFKWTQVMGPQVLLREANTAQPTFIAPQIDEGSVTLQFQLDVRLGQVVTGSDWVQILVTTDAPAQDDVPSTGIDPDAALPVQATQAAAYATAFFRDEVATHGGYLWEYSSDLSVRRGEDPAPPTRIWVQPPGTPTVGMAYLRMFEVTNDSRYLDAARDAGNALVWGQLVSGGWWYWIDFDPQVEQNQFYRRHLDAGLTDPDARDSLRNFTIFDDDNSQSALRFLMRLDTSLGFQDAAVHDAVDYALDAFLAAQYPNGAWPQGAFEPADDTLPVLDVRIPAEHRHTDMTWPAEPRTKFILYYTLNDKVSLNLIVILLEAYGTYGRGDCLVAAQRAGEYLIRAQLPDPHPGWAEQYNFAMEPAWARRFEPPAVSLPMIRSAFDALLALYAATGDDKYMQPFPAAIDWLLAAQVGENLWSHYYELETSLPLYVAGDYSLTLDSSLAFQYDYDFIPTPSNPIEPYSYEHTGRFGIPYLLVRADRALTQGRDALLAESQPNLDPDWNRQQAERLAGEIQSMISALDQRGAWVEDGNITTKRFALNLETIADYLETLARAGLATVPIPARVVRAE